MASQCVSHQKLALLLQGDLAGARALLDRYQSSIPSMDLDVAAWWCDAGARVLLASGEPQAAATQLAVGLRRVHTAHAAGIAAPLLERAAEIAAALHQPEAATRCLAAATALREHLGTPPWPVDQPGLALLKENLHTALGDAAFQSAWDVGTTMAWEQAVAEAIGQ